MNARTPFFVFSVAAHVALAFGLDEIEVKESRAATAIEIASTPKAKKETPPEPAKVEPEPPRPEARRAARRAAAPPPPAENTPPPPAAAAADALPDFGLSLSGGVGGDGVAVPVGGGAGPAPIAKSSAPVRRSLSQAAPAVASAGCDEPQVKPRPRSVPQPAYTAEARSAGVEGKVRVRLTVDEAGNVVEVTVIQGLGHGLDEAALAAARAATFEPATQCGKPVRATFTISMRFTAG